MRPIIIGAGPIGSAVARLIKDLNPLLIDARKRIGVPVQCTGLVSTRLKSLTGYPDSIIINKIRGANLFFKDSRAVIDSGRIIAHVIDRTAFDEFMLNQSSVKPLLGVRVNNYGSGVVRTTNGSYKTDLVIDCSGPRFIDKHLLGLQVVAKLSVDESMVNVYFDAAPGFFGWVVPLGNGYCRIGLAHTNPRPLLDKFLKRLGAGRIVEYNAGLIPLSVNHFFGDGFIRVGDAAGQVKAVSGGGLVTGIISAEIAGRAVRESFIARDFSESFFNNYYFKPWLRAVGNELRLHSIARWLLNRIDYNLLLRLINNNQSLFNNADMDFLSSLTGLFKPVNWLLLTKLLLSVMGF